MSKRYYFDDPALTEELQGLIDAGRQKEAMDLAYDAITEDPSYTVNEIVEFDRNQHWLGLVKKLFERFEELEEYEKCAELKKIIDGVTEANK